MLKALIFCVLLLAPLRGAAEAPIWDLPVTPSPRLGLAFPGDDPQYYQLIRDMGVGIVRVSAAWSRVQPRESAFDFSGLDRRVRGLDQLGLAPFLTFESNADWAADHVGTVKNGTPRDLTQWASFVRAVVERYNADGRDDMPGLAAPVQFYQVANEFLSPTNRSGGWAGSNAALIAYINAAHDAVKAADPNARFVLGGVAAFNADIALLALRDADFTVRQRFSKTSRTEFSRRDLRHPDIQRALNARFLPVLRETRYDIASVHLYGPESRDVARLSLFADLTQRPVISSECGGPSLDYGGAYSGHIHYAAVLRRNLNVWSTGASFCLWFGLGEAITSTYGNARVQLYDRQGREKPGAQAYRLLAKIAPVLRGVFVVGPDTYRIETTKGPIWIALSRAGLRGVSGVSGDDYSICINDAQHREALTAQWQQLAQICGTQGITLAGAGVLTLLGQR